MDDSIVTAAMVAIGDELLSGRTKDKNIAHLASMLTAVGIDLKEVRIIGDNEDGIVEAVNALRPRYTYVFTSGGIGPTHDDITADAVSKAFGVPCEHDAGAMEIMGAAYASRNIEFTESRKRMARMPRGATHIRNPVSVAPGFSIGNVHVMAGVPSIFQAMLDNLIPNLRTGEKIQSVTIHCPFGEGRISEPLGAIQDENPETVIGSYPQFDGTNFFTQIVIRGRVPSAIAKAESQVRKMLDEFGVGNAEP